MNLLTDAWIPVRDQGVYQEITLQDLLCQDNDWQISCPRDDFELATLQLLIALTQVIFMPEDIPALRTAEKEPLAPAAYQQGIQPFLDWFDLLHPIQPFMQIRGVKAKEITPIQKLFVGLPEGNNAAYFNPVGEISQVGLNYAAIALFNQASNSPSFGGGFKGSLRGEAPLTLLIKGASVRQTIWRNVICKTLLAEQGLLRESDFPSWIQTVQAEEKIYAHQIGICRGLFWQPAQIELEVRSIQGHCDCSGQIIAHCITGFKKERFRYYLMDTWPHPHSPRSWTEKKGEKKIHFTSFKATAPAWTQLSAYVALTEEAKEGSVPPLAVTQYRQAFRGQALHLVAGGYCNKKASILQRRHEQLSLTEGWEDHDDDLAQIVDLALNIMQVLIKKLYHFAKEIQLPDPGKFSNRARSQFYLRSEPELHTLLKDIDFDAFYPTLAALAHKLGQLAEDLFEDLSRPYRHTPGMIKHYVLSKAGLRKEISKISKSYQIEEAA